MMNRAEKYPNTKYFTYLNQNPKNKFTGDCVIRALSTAMEKPYNDVVIDLAYMQCRYGYDIGDPRLYDKYLVENGWKRYKQPKKDNNKKYTGIEWCEFLQFWNHPDWQRIVANIGTGHVVAIINGKIIDTWDSSSGCIGRMWIKTSY